MIPPPVPRVEHVAASLWSAPSAELLLPEVNQYYLYLSVEIRRGIVALSMHVVAKTRHLMTRSFTTDALPCGRLTYCRPPVQLNHQRMHQTPTPLFATPCIGATIAHVHVFPTHITYQQKFGRHITVAADMIASVEKRGDEYGFVILSTTTRRRIICTVATNCVDRLYKAIRDIQQFARANVLE